MVNYMDNNIKEHRKKNLLYYKYGIIKLGLGPYQGKKKKKN